MDINLTLTAEQVQRALMVLGSAPYAEIADIIEVIKHQANEQIFAENK